MPDHRKHRGQNPEDSKLFNEKTSAILLEAVKDLSYLLSRNYNMTSASKLVGDKFLLNSRQRIAIARSACADHSKDIRREKEVNIEFCSGRTILIDTYNILITIESALSGGFLFKSRDGCLRDISSIHGSYKRVEETTPALLLIGKNLSLLNPAKVIWYIDSPISNSGRLKQSINDLAAENQWNWEAELVHNPDTQLKHREEIAVTSDGIVLNEVKYWVNLAAIIIKNHIKDSKIIDLSF